MNVKGKGLRIKKARRFRRAFLFLIGNNLEVQSQSELNLPIRSQTNRAPDRRTNLSERTAGGGLRKCLSGLQDICRTQGISRAVCRDAQVWKGIAQGSRWISEVRVIEQIENLRSELNVRSFRQAKSLVDG